MTQTLKRIRLTLARGKDFPEGSTRHGYEFVAPLRADGLIDAEAWKDLRARCTVRRFWGTDPEEHGLLVHRPGGSWAFRYNSDDPDDLESGYRFGAHPFTTGEYVSLKDEDGDLHTFQVASVMGA